MRPGQDALSIHPALPLSRHHPETAPVKLLLFQNALLGRGVRDRPAAGSRGPRVAPAIISFMTDDSLIDRFVETLNARGLGTLPESEVPAELRTGPPDQFCSCHWKIRPAEHNPWVAGLEESVAPHHFPRLFLSLISRYRFAEFEIGRIMFFANTGQPVFHELALSIAKDPVMSPVLLQQGLLQFGAPDTVRYDPICFATAKKKKNRDAPIVQIDHEDILSRYGKGRIVAEIAPSFRHFIEEVIAAR